MKVWMYLARILRYSIMGTAFLFLGLYVVLAILRIQYPFELEWMEGCSVLHVQRILAGDKLYVEPSLNFTPFIYNPLYFYVSAGVSWVFGVGLFSLRAVSLLSSFGCMYLIYSIVANETDRWAGIVAAGLFAATFRLSGAWFDLARVDSLFLFLLLAAICATRKWRSDFSAILAAALLSFSFLTKQTASIMVFPIGIYFLFFSWKAFLSFTATATCVIGGFTLIFDYFHDGWYTYYAFFLPHNFAGEDSLYLSFWTANIIGPFPVASLLAVSYLAWEFRCGDKNKFIFYSLFLAGMLIASCLSLGKLLADANALMPAHAALCILFGLGMHTSLHAIERSFPRYRSVMAVLLYVVCLGQFAVMKYDPLRQLPTEADRLAGEQFVELVAQMEGEVFIPNHPYLAFLAGKKPHSLSICMRDVWRGDTESTAFSLMRELETAIERRRFGAVILDSRQFMLLPLFELGLGRSYEPQDVFMADRNVFVPVTGWPARPMHIFRVKR